MAIEIIVPEVGEVGMEVVFVEWLKSEGDLVKAGEPLFELDTSKAVMTIEAFADGVLADLRVGEGDSVSHGDVLAVLRDEGEDDERAQPEAADAPAALALAAVDVSGEAGAEDGLRRERVRAAVAEMTSRSWAAVPHFHLTLEADLTAALQEMKPTLAIARGIVVALQRHPECNLRWAEDGSLERREGVDLGLLVDAPAGLLLPAIRGAEGLSAERLGEALREAAERATTGELRPEDQGSRSLTFSNLGMFAVDRFEGVIAAPDVLLLAAGRIRLRQRQHQGEWVPRAVVDLTLSVDHRALDGADAARLLETLEQTLLEPEALR